MKKILVSILALINLAALAGNFEVTKGTADLGEGGIRETVVLLTEKRQFTFIPPYGFKSTIKTNLSRIEFVSPGGNIALSVQITTNFAGALPEESVLRERMSALYPKSQFVVASEAFFFQGSGRYLDVLRALPNGSRLMTRQAFLPFEEGVVEVALTSDEASFRKQRAIFGGLVSYFKIEPRKRQIRLETR